MCKLISHVHTLAFSFMNIICVNCINIFSLLYSTVLCIIYVPLYYVLFLLEEIKNYYYYYNVMYMYYSCVDLEVGGGRGPERIKNHEAIVFLAILVRIP